MRKASITEHQILTVLKSVEAGQIFQNGCREAGISEASDYNRKAKYRGMEAADINEIKGLEDENSRLKQMFTDLSLEIGPPARLNQSWSVDSMHDALGCWRRFRTFNVVDDFNHEAIAIEIDMNIPAQRVIRMLNRIVDNRGYRWVRMDIGPEFISVALTQWAEDHGVVLEFIHPP